MGSVLLIAILFVLATVVVCLVPVQSVLVAVAVNTAVFGLRMICVAHHESIGRGWECRARLAVWARWFSGSSHVALVHWVVYLDVCGGCGNGR